MKIVKKIVMYVLSAGKLSNNSMISMIKYLKPIQI